MLSRLIPQAIVCDGQILARSPDVLDDWQATFDEIVSAFALPPNVNSPECLFVTPFAHRHIAVVTLLGRRFRFLVVPRRIYDSVPDPFAIAAQFPVRWNAAGSLDALELPESITSQRSVGQLDRVLKNGDGPFLLGACQTLVDSGRIALRRDESDPKLVREIWQLLPDSTRRQTWFATHAYSVSLEFSLVVYQRNSPTISKAT